MQKYAIAFERLAKNVAKLVSNPQAKFMRAYTYTRTPRLRTLVSKAVDRTAEELIRITESTVKASWFLSTEKNNAIFAQYLKQFEGIPRTDLFAHPDVKKMNDYLAFSKGRFSDAIWNIVPGLRKEMEVHLAIGIMQGDSAKVISQRIRQYLNEPNKLFRRVRDANGNLVMSKAMREYHPGPGVYRSSYKNAMRVARTEGNQAYLRNDSERWNASDLVLGIDIELSDSHPEYNYIEICEELEGEYPKDFLFVGWHPQCLCHATPILMDHEEFRRYLRKEIEWNPKYITEYPEKFKDYINNNKEKLEKHNPYFYQDNKEAINKIIEEKQKAAGITPGEIKGAKGTDLTKTDWYNNQQVRDAITKGIEHPDVYYRDTMLENIASIQGFTGTPELMDAKALAAYDGIQAYRGVQGSALPAQEYIKQFKTGEYYGGKGVYGNGTYMAAENAAARSRTAAYELAKNIYGDTDAANVMAIKVPKTANLIECEEAWNQQQALLKSLDDDIWQKIVDKFKAGEMTNDEFYEANRAHRQVREYFDDVGRVAAFKGYDGMIMKFQEQDYYIILNRTILKVAK
jgi:hypothetical protein